MILLAIGIWDLAYFWAVTDPNSELGWDQLAQLGVIALAVITGAALVYRYVVLPERERAKQDRVELLARVEMERQDRVKAEERERETTKVALPALQESSKAMDSVLRVLERGRTGQ
jgi:Tfp pilus assembly protein PilO